MFFNKTLLKIINTKFKAFSRLTSCKSLVESLGTPISGNEAFKNNVELDIDRKYKMTSPLNQGFPVFGFSLQLSPDFISISYQVVSKVTD